MTVVFKEVEHYDHGQREH